MGIQNEKWISYREKNKQNPDTTKDERKKMI